MSTENATFIPPKGRHEVSVGTSLTRFLKQRKGTQVKQTKPITSYYHFKYNFMPESVDVNKPGQIDLVTNEITNARVERACAQSNEVHVFRGKEEPSKDIECVLIYDQESGLFSLEKLDSTFNLTHEGKSQPKSRTSASPLPTPSPAIKNDDLEEILFREMQETLASAKEDSKGEDSDNIPLINNTKRPAHLPPKPEPVRPPPTEVDSRGKSRPKLKQGKANTNPSSVPSSSTLPPAPVSIPKPPSPTQNRGLNKRKASQQNQTNTFEVEEEELDFGKPSRPLKRPHTSPLTGPPPVTAYPSLALPGAGDSCNIPSSDGLALPGTTTVNLAPPITSTIDDDDDTDGSLVDVLTANTGEDEIFGDGIADSGDVDDLDAELNRQLGGIYEEFDDGFATIAGDGDNGDGDADPDDESDMEDIFGGEEEEPEPTPSKAPQSMISYAAGNGGAAYGDDDDDEDDYTSSEESD